MDQRTNEKKEIKLSCGFVFQSDRKRTDIKTDIFVEKG
jgi:hypothetical protein